MDTGQRGALLETHRELLERLLPGVTLSGLPVRAGQFHYVVLGPDRVVCLARTQAAAVRLPRRAAGLAVLSGLDLGVAVPEPLVVAHDEQPYLVLSRIPGAPLDIDLLDDPAVAEHVARQCSALLDRLAAVGAEPRSRKTFPAADRHRWRDFAADVRRELYPLMNSSGRARADRELAALATLPYRATALVHGDLGGENLLWDNATECPTLLGIVDWDGAALADQAEDLAALGAGYGTAFLKTLLPLTASTDASLSARIATIRATFALQQAHDAYHDGDAEELADGLSGYR